MWNENEEGKQRQEWERTRWLATVVAQANGAKKIKKPQHLAVFPWEKKAITKL